MKYEVEGFDEALVFCTIDLLRHIERDKTNKVDPQTPTHAGEIAAFGMGVHMRRTFNPTYDEIRTSPQPRGYRHAKLYLAGIQSYDMAPLPVPIRIDERLNDFSSDTREEIVAGMAAAKKLGKTFGTEPEAAIYQTSEGLGAVTLKVQEAGAVLDELRVKPGAHGMVGMHGGAIEGLTTRCIREIDPSVSFKSAMVAVGGQFDKCEGARVSFDKDGRVLKVEDLRLPAHLKAVFAVLA